MIQIFTKLFELFELSRVPLGDQGSIRWGGRRSLDTEGAFKNGVTEGAMDTESALDGAAEGATDM